MENCIFVYKNKAFLKEYCISIEKFHQLELQYFLNNEKQKDASRPVDVKLFKLRNWSPNPALVWWENNYHMVRNFYSRKFSFRCIAFDKLIQESEQTIAGLIQWCILPQKDDILPIYMKGKPHDVDDLIKKLQIEKSFSCVKQDLKRQNVDKINDFDFPFSDKVSDVFNELYDIFALGDGVLRGNFLKEMDKCQELIEPYLLEQRKLHQKDLQEYLQETKIEKL